MAVANLYPLSRCRFGVKDRSYENRGDLRGFLAELKESYPREGMIKTIAGVLLVQEHNTPHVLLLKTKGNFFEFPSGTLNAGEDEISGLKRTLNQCLAARPTFERDWQIGKCVAMWWRPQFDDVMYPYCPPHITKPKELKKIFMVHLAENEYFEIPRNWEIVAVPLFELYDNSQRFGVVISTIALQLSWFKFNMIDPVA